jgi:ribosomal protein L28
MNPFLEPAKRHKKVRMSAAALRTTGIKAEKRMLSLSLEYIPYARTQQI